jgi:outer membrane protein OmpA-like peptidoglycan-associated protein
MPQPRDGACSAGSRTTTRAPVIARPEPPRTAERPAAQSWSTEVRRARALAQDFKATTGDRIFFSDGSTDIGSRARAVLSSQVEWLKRFPQVPVTVIAHADDRGGKELNEDLSIRRGEAVRARLVAEGIDEKRIRVLPLGREQPVATCDAPGCSAQNRRVVTVIGDGEQASAQRRP